MLSSRSVKSPAPPVAPNMLTCPVLMLVTEPMERSVLVAVVSEAIAGGVNAVQLRDRDAAAGVLRATARVLRRRIGRVPLVVNSGTVAHAVSGADGVHLPESGPPMMQVRARIGNRALVGRSVHSVAAAEAAEGEGVDYVVAGTVFASRSHPGSGGGGLDLLAAICRSVDLPVIAIGGILPENTGDCMSAGAAGVAVLSGVLRAADPRVAASRYRDALAAARG